MMATKRILVVEDDPKVVVFLEDGLTFMGYEVLIARDGVSGLYKAQKEKPDLVILDVMMPKMDGYQVCEHLRNNPKTKDIPILMLTARGQQRDKVKGLNIGADDYLPKPYNKAEFEARVKALLRRTSHPPFSIERNDCIFCLFCKPERRINIRVNGVLTLQDITKQNLDINPNVYAHQAKNTLLLDWRFNSKQLGKQLFHKIFSTP